MSKRVVKKNSSISVVGWWFEKKRKKLYRGEVELESVSLKMRKPFDDFFMQPGEYLDED